MSTTASTRPRRGTSSPTSFRSGVATAIVVAAVAAVVALAAADAVRREDTGTFPAALRGELVYSDAACHRHAVRLPGLARRDFLTVGCGVFTRRDNLGVKDGAVAWFAYPVPGGTTTLLRPRDLPAGLRVSAVAWLQGDRFAAILEPGGAVTVWRARRRLADAARGEYTELRASPSGAYFAALGSGSIWVGDRTGRALWQTDGRALAWSPDERYVALAREGDVAFAAAATGKELARIAVDARDVDWRLR